MSIYGCELEQMNQDYSFHSLLESLSILSEQISFSYILSDVTGLTEDSEYALDFRRDKYGKKIEDDKKETKDNKSFKDKVKALLSSIKGIFEKFITFIKDIFEKAINSVLKVYQSFSIQDKFFSTFGKKVTYDNLMKAKNAGWKGLKRMSDHVINRDLNFSDTLLYQLSNDKIYQSINILDIMGVRKEVIGDPIKDLGSYFSNINDIINNYDEDNKAELMEKYKDNYNKIDNVISQVYKALDSSLSMINRGAEQGSKPIVYSGKEGENYFYPDTVQFTNTKKMAEEGITKTRSIRVTETKNINNARKELKDLENYLNESGDKPQALINMVLQTAALKIRVATYDLKGMLKLYDTLHIMAIKSYVKFWFAIKKYRVA